MQMRLDKQEWRLKVADMEQDNKYCGAFNDNLRITKNF